MSEAAWPFVRSMVAVEATPSTNDDAKRRLLEGGREPLPLCLRALRQTRGRGRGSNSWWSDEGSLTFTLVLDPAAEGISREREPLIALSCAVAAIRVAERRAPLRPIGLRWPNDLESGDRKFGGLLTERVETPDGPRMLVGIGINVRSRLENAPEAIQAMATTIESLRGEPTPPEEMEAVLRDVLEEVGLTLGRLASGDPTLPDEWTRRDLLRGRPLRVKQGERIIIGVGRGITREGALIVDAPEGTIELVGGQILREGAG